MWIRASGFLEWEVVNRTRAVVRFIRAVDGTVADEGILDKPAPA